ncbi:MAG: hypothetical protein Q9166_007237 [cf. Caloplaca sp. 2 TL-2023]
MAPTRNKKANRNHPRATRGHGITTNGDGSYHSSGELPPENPFAPLEDSNQAPPNLFQPPSSAGFNFKAPSKPEPASSQSAAPTSGSIFTFPSISVPESTDNVAPAIELSNDQQVVHDASFADQPLGMRVRECFRTNDQPWHHYYVTQMEALIDGNDIAQTAAANEAVVQAHEWIRSLEAQLKAKDDEIAKHQGQIEEIGTLQEQYTARWHATLQEKEGAIYQYREAAEEQNKVVANLKQKLHEAEKENKKSSANVKASNKRSEEQKQTIEKNEQTIEGLQGTNQRLKKDLEEEKKKRTELQKDSALKDPENLEAQNHRLKAENEKVVKDLHEFYARKHAAEEKEVNKELENLANVKAGLDAEYGKLQERILGDKKIIEECNQEIQLLKEEVDEYKKREMAKAAITKEKATEANIENPGPPSSINPGNELMRFSPAPSPPPSSLGPYQWRPQTESMMGDSGDEDDEGRRPSTPSLMSPITLFVQEPLEYKIPIPKSTSNQGTQTDAASSPKLEFAPSSLANVGLSDAPSGDDKPMMKDACDQGTQYSPPPSPLMLSIPPLTFPNLGSPDEPSSDSNSGLKPSKPTCDQGIQTDTPKLNISETNSLVNFTPSSAVLPPPPDKRSIKEQFPRRWLWNLLMLLAMVVLMFAAFYGESARRERMMWLQANDFTRRAIYSVRAGSGTSTNIPVWLWRDQLLDVSRRYFK